MGHGPVDDNYSSIDPAALGGAAGSLQKSVDGVHANVPGLTSRFAYFGIDTGNLGTLSRIASELGQLIPELRRRQSMAAQLVAEAPQNGKVAYFQGDLLGQFHTVAAARAQAHIDAEQVQHARSTHQPVPQTVFDHLQAYGNDADYAQAFVTDVGPDGVAWLLIDAQLADPGEQPDQRRMSALGNTLATASYRVTFDGTYLRKLNYALRALDLNTNATGSVRLFTPMLQYGTWSQKSLTAIADLTLNKGGGFPDFDATGDFDGDAVKYVFQALSRNPIAAGDYFAANKTWLYDDARSSPATGEYGPANQAFADFVRAATVDSRGLFAQWALSGGPQHNVAEQNADWLVNKVGGEDSGDWGDAMNLTFADIGREYLDSFVSTLSSPVDVSGVPAPWLPVNAGEQTWVKFLKAGMLSDKGLFVLTAAFQAKAGQLTDQLTGEVSAGQHAGTNTTPYLDPERATAWLRYARNQLQADFKSALDAADQKVSKDYQDRVSAMTGLVSKGLDWVTDPTGIPGDIKSMATGAVKDWVSSELGSLLAGEKPELPGQKVKISGTALDGLADYANDAISQYNAGLASDPQSPWAGRYNDGDVRWDGRPGLYQDPKHPFTNADGTIKPISEFTSDPRALQAFVEWLQDPNVQSHVAGSPGRPN